MIVRAMDTDGSVFQRVREDLADQAENMIDVGTM